MMNEERLQSLQKRSVKGDIITACIFLIGECRGARAIFFSEKCSEMAKSNAGNSE